MSVHTIASDAARAHTAHTKPRLKKVGIGWTCEGDGLVLHAMTPKAAYDHWEFASCKGYAWMAAQRRDWLVRGSTGLTGGERG
jgi:hypothetical protein